MYFCVKNINLNPKIDALGYHLHYLALLYFSRDLTQRDNYTVYK